MCIYKYTCIYSLSAYVFINRNTHTHKDNCSNDVCCGVSGGLDLYIKCTAT